MSSSPRLEDLLEQIYSLADKGLSVLDGSIERDEALGTERPARLCQLHQLRSERVQLSKRLTLAKDLASALAELCRGPAHPYSCIASATGCPRCAMALQERRVRAREALDRWHAPVMPPVEVEGWPAADDSGEARL
ncbi:MAG TPA: hypothetical protein VF017_15350 [Thermoanaerobaculia bacterium]|nr:hypothetical protein [Thermoanaerobaculia bacterium]